MNDWDEEEDATPRSAGCLSADLQHLLFCRRVLEEACDETNPVLERFKFSAILQSNLDEFFVTRVSSLLRRTPVRNRQSTDHFCELNAVLKSVRELYTDHDRVHADLITDLAAHGVYVCQASDLDAASLAFLARETDVWNIQEIDARKMRSGVTYAARLANSSDHAPSFIPLPSGALRLPGSDSSFVLMEDAVFSLMRHQRGTAEPVALVRVTRGAGPRCWSGRAEDVLLSLADRENQPVVRLECSAGAQSQLVQHLCSLLGVPPACVFTHDAPFDFSFVDSLRNALAHRRDLFYPPHIPRQPVDPLPGLVPVRDVLLTHPYDSAGSLLQLLSWAAVDPNVSAIRITLYRVAADSAVVRALTAAARRKTVTIYLELRARGDEARNVAWSRVLERAGCRVVCGLPGLKVHCKLLLVTRAGGPSLALIGTGNFNEDTAAAYTDHALLTADPSIVADVAAVLDGLDGDCAAVHTQHLLVAPHGLFSGIIALIGGEAAMAASGAPSYIGIKANRLTDPRVVAALAAAAGAGVTVDLLVRGACCVPASPRVRVFSIVGRFLEHARVYIFGPRDRSRIFVSSADLMPRCLKRRVEVAAPVRDAALRRRLEDIFATQLSDTARLRVMGPDGAYSRPARGCEPFDSQRHFCECWEP